MHSKYVVGMLPRYSEWYGKERKRKGMEGEGMEGNGRGGKDNKELTLIHLTLIVAKQYQYKGSK